MNNPYNLFPAECVSVVPRGQKEPDHSARYRTVCQSMGHPNGRLGGGSSWVTVHPAILRSFHTANSIDAGTVGASREAPFYVTVKKAPGAGQCRRPSLGGEKRKVNFSCDSLLSQTNNG